MKTDVGIAFRQIVVEFQKSFELTDKEMKEILDFEKELLWQFGRKEQFLISGRRWMG